MVKHPIRLHERLEDGGEHVWRNARPGVLHPQDQLAALLPGGQPDLTPWSVYLAALLSRFAKTCSRRVGSASRRTGSGGRSTVSVCWRSSMSGRVASTVRSTTGAMSTASLRSSILPRVMRDTSRRASTILAMCCTCRSIISPPPLPDARAAPGPPVFGVAGGGGGGGGVFGCGGPPPPRTCPRPPPPPPPPRAGRPSPPPPPGGGGGLPPPGGGGGSKAGP